MVRLTSQFVIVAACLSSLVLSSPVTPENNFVAIPFTKKAPFSKTAKQVLERDRARLAVHFNKFETDASSGDAPATNIDDTYLVATKVGSQTFNLIVDTGSSNTWVGAGTKYKPGTTSHSTKESFSVSYGSGQVSGTEYTDQVTIGGLTIKSQSIGDGTRASGFDGVDGIIGFGPTDLTSDTVDGEDTVPTVMDNLFNQGSISSQVLGVSFAPESGSDTDDTNGELTLGGTDSSKFSGSITYVSKTSTSPYSAYWGISVSSITYGSTSLLSSAKAIVDTGTTLIYIPTSAYKAFLSAAGGKTDSNSGLAKFSTAPTKNFAFTIGGVSFSLTPSQYLIPSSQLSFFGLSSGHYSWISDGGSSAADVNFIIGQKFLENYYSVYDTTNNRVGFATAA